MQESKAIDKLREKYLNLLIHTLHANVKKSVQNVHVDDSIIQHYGLAIEEDCFNKHRSMLSSYTRDYTKAITVARLNIEKYTANQQLYPTISNALEESAKEKGTNNHGRKNIFFSTFVQS